MSAFQAALLGVLQGLTEFLPISSSAHLIILPWICGWKQPGLAFDVALHLGTLLALLVYFAKDWVELIQGVLEALRTRSLASARSRLAVGILVATIPAAVIGLLAEDAIESAFHPADPVQRTRAILVIAAALAGVALLLLAAEVVARHERDHRDLSIRQALLVGLAQASALIPGVSRSGATITAGLFLGLKRESAARFSFLLSAPIMIGAGGKKMLDLAMSPPPTDELRAFAWGFAAAAASGFVAIHGLLRYLRRHRVHPFVIYRLALASLLVILAVRSV